MSNPEQEIPNVSPATQETNKALSHDAVESIGTLALHDEAEAALNEPIDSLVDKNMRLLELSDKIHDVLAPYASIFSDYLPDPSKNERTWRNKLKDPDSPRSSAWHINRQLPVLTAQYQFDMGYAIGETDNVINHVRMRVNEAQAEEHDTSGPNQGTLWMDYKYTKGRITSIDSGTMALGHYMVDVKRANTLGLLEAVSPAKTNETQPANAFADFLRSATGNNDVIIKLDEKEPGITLLDGSGGGAVDAEYRFDATSSEFTLVGSSTVLQPNTGERVTRPNSLTDQEFLDIVSGALALIPTDMKSYEPALQQ